MLKQLNEEKIYKRMVAALTTRQLPVFMKAPFTKEQRKMRKASKTKLKNNTNPISTMKLTAAEKMAPIYAYSITPIDNMYENVDNLRQRMPIERQTRGVGYVYNEYNESPLAYNPPYGFLPELATLSPEKLLEYANHFSVLKYQYMEQGDYWHAWLFGWRQRMIERILNGSSTIQIKDQ